MTDDHRDFLGETIKEGDIVAFASLKDKSTVLNFGIVNQTKYNYLNQSTKTKKAVGVFAVEKSDNRNWSVKNKGKEIVLTDCDRCLVVDKRRVPKEVWNLLNLSFVKQER